MKAKHVITTFAFAAAMTLGAVAGLSMSRNVKAAHATDTKTLYCKVAQDWWKTDGAAVGVHYWGGAASTSWPGIRMTAVEGDEDVWKFDVPSDSTKLIFVRVNSSGEIADWGAKTADLDMPTGENDLYTITSADPVWGDPGVAGEWSKYVAPSPKPAPSETKVNVGFYPDGKVEGDIYAYAWNNDYNPAQNAEWPGVKLEATDGVYGASFSQSYDKVIFNGGKESWQTKDLEVQANKIFKLRDAAGNGGWVENKDDPLPKTESGYTYRINGGAAVKIYEEDQIEPGDEYMEAQYELVLDVQKDQVFTFYKNGALKDVKAWGDDNNFAYSDENKDLTVLANAESAHLYFKIYGEDNMGCWLGGYAPEKDDPSEEMNTFYVWDRAGVFGDTLAAVNVFGFGQAENIKAMDWPGSHSGVSAHLLEGVDHLYKVQLSVSYPKFIIDNVVEEAVQHQTCDIEEIKAGKVFAVYTEPFGLLDPNAGKFGGEWIELDDLSVENGCYLRGDWTNGWTVAGQKVMELDGEVENQIKIEGLQLTKDNVLKVVTYTDHVPSWHSATEVWVGDKQIEEGGIDENGNAIIQETGKYNLYVKTDTWVYYFVYSEDESLERAEAFIDLFYEKLNAEGVCDVTGVNTNKEKLAAAWGEIKAAYAAITDEDAKQLLIKADESNSVKFNGFAKLYDLILVKYASDLGADADFLGRSPSGSNSAVVIRSDNTFAIIMATVSVITLAGLAVVMIKRKSTNK